MVKKNTEYKGIQKKLVAAIAMVLVASIMVVTSSYAWFTLSTAPEVTGIKTSVGSNGNLEMALQPESGNLSEIVTGGTGSSNNWPDSNYFWGNLVNLSDAKYGMDNMVLAPARLNAAFDESNSVLGTHTHELTDVTGLEVGGNYNGEKITEIAGPTDDKYTVTTEYYMTEVYKVVTGSGYLQTPEYGSDGRLVKLDANTVNGIFDAAQGAFQGENDDFGVRAVGTTSNMSPEAYALRQAKTAVNSAIDGAKSSGAKSMREYAVPMANMIVQNKLNSAYKYVKADYDIVNAAVTDLEKVIANLEEAMKQAVVAVGLSQGHNFTSDKVTITADAITVDGATLVWEGQEETADQPAIASLATQRDDLLAAAALIASMKTELGKSRTALESVADQNAPTYDELQAAMAPLVSVTGIKVVNGTNVYTLESTDQKDLMPIAAALIGGGASIVLTDGIYADVATMVGDYAQAGLSMTIDASGTGYQDMVEAVFPNGGGKATVNFTMATEAKAPTNGYHLVYVSTWMASLSLAKEGTASALITDTYGYIVDLAFRTNAADSSLLLQTEAADRVAGDDNSSVTWGGGSYMQFSTDNLEFTVQQIVNLMDYIRVVMVDNTGKIYGIAKLDMSLEDVLDGSGVKVEYDETQHDFFRNATAEEVAAGATEGTKYAQQLANGTIENGVVKAYLYLYNFEINAGVVKIGDKQTSNAIMPLMQNTAQGLSCLVYLDGDEVENADVAINGNSMTGTMNLQFASSAALDPMDYTFASKPTLPKPSASLAGNTLTITAPADGLSEEVKAEDIKYDIYTKVGDNEVTIATGVAAGSHTVDLTQAASGATGDFEIFVRATHADCNPSEGVSAGTITLS